MRRGERLAVIPGREMAVRLSVARQIAAEDVGERGQTIVCLVSGDVVDVRRVAQVRGLVSDMAGRRVRVVSPRERLAKRSGLDDPFVRKLFV